MTFHVFQIFYSPETYRALEPGFTPLDNTLNQRPDWYEFWVILNFLRTQTLEDGHWYGFLSPRFRKKSGLTSETVLGTLARLNDQAEVLLLPSNWDQTAVAVNQFEQGEHQHSGLLAAAKAFLVPRGVDPEAIVSHTGNSTYSNYVIARKAYWSAWLKWAEAFFSYCEAPGSPLGTATTYYPAGTERRVPMKVFVQERLSSVVLSSWGPGIVGIDLGDKAVVSMAEHAPIPVRRRLQALDQLKRCYTASKDPVFLSAFFRMRARLYERQ